MIAGIIGALVGAVQFFLLKRLMDCALHGERGAAKYIIAKLVIYAAAVALAMTLLRDQIMGVGIGLAVGMLGSTILSSIHALVLGKGKGA